MSIKLCKECKYCDTPWLDELFSKYENSICVRPLPNINLVDGTHKLNDEKCRQERMTGIANCGPEGKYWAPKNPPEDGK